MLKTFELDVEVSGKGQTKQHAFAAALSGTQRAVGKKGDNVLVRIQPQDVYVLEAREMTRVDRFLFIFLPRERKQYYVKLKVTVQVSVIETGHIEFKR